MIYSTKTDDSDRDVDMSPMLKKELQVRWMKSKDKHGLIFKARTGKPLDPKNVLNRWFKPAAERAKKKA